MQRVMKLQIIFLIVAFHGSWANSPNARVCQTPACRKIADEFVNYMDKSVQPCDNFYKFACGNLTKNHVVSKNEVYPDPNAISSFVKNGLDSVSENDPETFRLLKQYYHKCRDEEPVTKDKLVEMLNGLGGWPLIAGPSWVESDFDLIDAIYNFRKFGYKANYFFDLQTIKDPENESRTILQIQPTWDITKKFESYDFSSEKFDATLLEFVTMDLGYSNFNKTELSDTLNFGITLVGELGLIYLKAIEESSKTMTVEDLKKEYPTFSWQKYLQKMLFDRVDVHKIDKIVVYYPDFMKTVIDLVDKTPKRILANYLFWMFFMDLKLDLVESSPGVNKFDCWKKLNRKLAPALSMYLINHYIDVKQKMTSMSVNLKEAFYRLINDAKWLDKKTKDKSLKKLKDIEFETSFFNNNTSTLNLDKYYNSSLSRIRKCHCVKKISDIDGILLEESFSYVYSSDKYDEPESNLYLRVIPYAEYNPKSNNVEIFAAVVRVMNQKMEIPMYVDYGQLGYIMGHELAHAFDNVDELFGTGVDTPSAQYFLNGIKCLVDQYDNFKNEESKLKVNGSRTVRENLSDNAGLKAAYLAYSKLTTEEEPRLPGLEEYSSKQMFWLSFAHAYCAKYGSDLLQQQFDKDIHALQEFRVIGSLQNRPEFSEDFHCKDGSYMKPTKRCGVW